MTKNTKGLVNMLLSRAWVSALDRTHDSGIRASSSSVTVFVHSLTIYIVVDFSGIMQQPELISAHHFPGFSVSQLMTEVDNKAEAEGVYKITTIQKYIELIMMSKDKYLKEVYNLISLTYICCMCVISTDKNLNNSKRK